MDGAAAQPLTGTEGAVLLFWSPDSRSLAFIGGGKLKKIAASGGQPRELADAVTFGGTWNRDDLIGGGPTTAVTALDDKAGETGHGLPFFLPDGKHFLYSAVTRNGERANFVASLDSTERARLINDGGNAQYSNGFLFFLRKDTLTGDATPQAQQITIGTGLFRGAAYSVSDAGFLVYQTGARKRWPLVSFDRKGTQIESFDQGADGDLELSPNGKQWRADRRWRRSVRAGRRRCRYRGSAYPRPPMEVTDELVGGRTVPSI
jgi:hypothetical protein